MSEMTSRITDWLKTAWDGLKTGVSNGVNIFKKSWVVLSLTTALIGAAGYVYYLDHKNAKVQEQLDEQKKKTDELRVQTEQVIEINKQNAIIVEQLKQDRVRTEQLVESFNNQIDLNSKIISTIGSKVSTLKDGELAPVLRETIRELQALRLERAK